MIKNAIFFVIFVAAFSLAIIKQDPVDGSIQIYTRNPANLLVISANGNVGVGTLAPGAKLEVAGTVSASAFVGNGTGLTDLPQVATSSFAISMNATGLLGAITVATGNAVMSITASGNVGIGTVSPGYPLEVMGNIRTSGGVIAVSNVNAGTSILSSTGLYRGSISYGYYGFGTPTALGANPMIIRSGDSLTYTDGYLAFLTSGAERMRVDNIGNVGVGMMNPIATLHVSSNVAGTPIIQIGNAVVPNALVVSTNGYVGIGTTSPLSRLDVRGQTLIANTDYDGSGVGSAIAIALGASSGDTFTKISALKTGGTAWSNLVLQYGGGNVGIGTTTPLATLHVSSNVIGTPIMQVGNATVPNALVVSQNGNVGIGTATPIATLEVNGTFAALVGINAQTGTSYTLAASDNNKLLTMDNASPITVTIPVNSSVSIPVGFQCTIVRKSTGTLTLSKAGGVTVISTSTALTFTATGSAGTLIKIATDQWLAFGDMN